MILELNKDFDKKLDIVIGKEMRKKRKSERYSYTAIAKLIGVNPNTYACYETGRRSCPISVLRKFCSFFEIDTLEFLREAFYKVDNNILEEDEQKTFAIGD